MTRVRLALLAMALATLVAPQSVLAGKVGHGGTPSASMTVNCWYDVNTNTYDVLAYVAPEVYYDGTSVAGGSSFAQAYGRTSNKASAPLMFLSDTLTLDSNYIQGVDLPGGETAYGWVTVLFIYTDPDGVRHVLASATGKCQRGDYFVV